MMEGRIKQEDGKVTCSALLKSLGGISEDGGLIETEGRKEGYLCVCSVLDVYIRVHVR